MPGNGKSEREPAQMELLLEVGRLLSTTLDLSQLLHTIMEYAGRVVGAERASLFLLDEATQELYFDVAMGLGPAAQKVRLKLGQGIAGSVAKEGTPLIINEVRKDPRWSPSMDSESGFVTRSILASPLRIKDKTIGVVEAINHVEGPFTFEDLRIFESFASQAAVAIENARLFASLREEKAKLDTVISEMRDGAILADEAGKVLLLNASARKLLAIGLDPKSTLQEIVGPMTLTPPLAEIFKSRDRAVNFDLVRTIPKKLILAGVAAKTPLAGASRVGAREGWLCLFRDVTEERQEELLKRSFLSLISHKLKTPLASITGYSQILLDSHKGAAGGGESGASPSTSVPPSGAPAEDPTVRALDTIYRQGRKLSQLVDKLINFVTIEEIEEKGLESRSFALDGVFANVLQSMSEWLRESGAKLDLPLKTDLTAYGDPLLIEEVVKNLIENGVKFNPKPEKKVRVSALNEDGRVRVEVEDEGAGIPPEEQGRIFQKFYQVEASFTGQVEGWGLGLPFVQKVVQQHKGEVRIRSELGKGTAVAFTLPKGP